jgi:hypothetical protein
LGDLGVTGARLITPGDAARSVVYLRLSRRGAFQMPPLASLVVGDAGAAVVASYIDGLGGCL